MNWWTERMRPALVRTGDRWGRKLTDWLREKFDIPRRRDS